MWVTRKRSTAKGPAEAPITGVASGSLGTAANLDDTQVLRTADLQAAAAAPPPVEPAAAHAEPARAPTQPAAPGASVVARGTPTAPVPASAPSSRPRNVP